MSDTIFLLYVPCSCVCLTDFMRARLFAVFGMLDFEFATVVYSAQTFSVPSFSALFLLPLVRPTTSIAAGVKCAINRGRSFYRMQKLAELLPRQMENFQSANYLLWLGGQRKFGIESWNNRLILQ